METTEAITNLGGLEPVLYLLGAVIYLLRLSGFVAKRTLYAAGLLLPRYFKFMRHELGLLVPIYKGANIIFIEAKTPEHVDNYHTRYDQSTRGNVGEAEWQFDSTKVKVGA